MISMSFGIRPSLAVFFIIPVLFCFVFEHEIIYKTRALAVLDFYYAKSACILAKFENLQNSDRPFRLLFEDFRLCSPYNNVN